MSYKNNQNSEDYTELDILIDDNNIHSDEVAITVPEADKKIKITAIVFVVIAAVAVALFVWFKIASKTKPAQPVEPLKIEDIQGLFYDPLSGMYFDFKPGEKTIVIPAYIYGESEVDSAAFSDGTVSSAGTEEQTMTFDGEYNGGYTEEYMNEAVAMEYISQNALESAYDEYINNNNIIYGSYYDFLIGYGISSEELSEFDQIYGITAMGKSYEQNGYWKYDSENMEIRIFDADGYEMGQFKIIGDAIVSPEGYMTGEFSDNSGSFVYSSNGYRETMILYSDGRFIVESAYDGEITKYYAGTYKVDDNYIVTYMDGMWIPYTRVEGGISNFVCRKQK